MAGLLFPPFIAKWINFKTRLQFLSPLVAYEFLSRPRLKGLSERVFQVEQHARTGWRTVTFSGAIFEFPEGCNFFPSDILKFQRAETFSGTMF